MDGTELKRLNIARYQAAMEVAECAETLKVAGKDLGKSWRLAGKIVVFHAAKERYQKAVSEGLAMVQGVE